MRKIIAVVGLCGTGKSAAVHLLQQDLAAPIVYFGGVVLGELERRGLEVNSANERTIREQLRREHGMAAIAITAQPEIASALTQSPVVIIDGLYSFAEYERLKESYGADLYLIAIHSSRQLRYARMAQRKVRPLTPQEVDSRDLAEIKHLDKGGPIAIADYHVINESSLNDLSARLGPIVLNIADAVR